MPSRVYSWMLHENTRLPFSLSPSFLLTFLSLTKIHFFFLSLLPFLLQISQTDLFWRILRCVSEESHGHSQHFSFSKGFLIPERWKRKGLLLLNEFLFLEAVWNLIRASRGFGHVLAAWLHWIWTSGRWNVTWLM